MEKILELSHDYSVEALKLYQILKSENNEVYLGRKLLTNGIELGLNVRGEKSKEQITKYIVEMKYLLNVICDADYLSRDVIENMMSIADSISENITKEEW